MNLIRLLLKKLWCKEAVSIFMAQVPLPPRMFFSKYHRIWECLDMANYQHGGDSIRFKVVSYNILAQCHLQRHRYLYAGCTPQDLIWNNRFSQLIHEITNLAPDILCLQELEGHLLNQFNHVLAQIGLIGVYKQRTNEQDGCAIYFNQTLFDLVDYVTVEYHQPKLPLLNKDNVGLVVKMVPKMYPYTALVVATTHLLYNPKRTDVRLAQLQLLLAEIDRFAYYNIENNSGYLPIILTGDFNSTPQSPVIKLLEEGCINFSAHNLFSCNWKDIGVTNNSQHISVYLNRIQGRATDFSELKIHNSDIAAPLSADTLPDAYDSMFKSNSISCPIELSSVYHNVKANGNIEATSFHNSWVTVDYIYYSRCSNLRVLERLWLPSSVDCQFMGCMPNDVFGSDHFSLAAVFELKLQ